MRPLDCCNDHKKVEVDQRTDYDHPMVNFTQILFIDSPFRVDNEIC